nr:PREDICTED: uncharacterized protein LOC107398781 [Tribolium castaneum]|eukprot:XP_015839636.1 PREDICTED: uncharacterized protein LOC107398781 [Tribolium castaneum]
MMKIANIFCIIINLLNVLAQIGYIKQNFGKELLLRYACGIQLTIYTIVTMLFEFLVEQNVKKLMDEALSEMWPIDFCGLEIKKLILKRSTVMNSIFYFMFAWFAILAIVMLPMWGDQSEWLLYDRICKEFFATWWKIPYYFYFTTFPVVAFSGIRLPGLLLYTILQTHMQIILINQKLVQISGGLDGINDVRMIDQKNYQKRIYKGLRLCVAHHVAIKRWLQKPVKIVQSLMPIYIIMGSTIFISLLFATVYSFRDSSNILKVRMSVVLMICCLILCMGAEAGQALSNETSRVFDTLVNCPWHLWDQKNKKALTIFLPNTLQPVTITLAGITLNYSFAVGLLKSSASYALVLYNMRN